MSENTKLYGYLIYNEPEFSIPPLSAEVCRLGET